MTSAELFIGTKKVKLAGKTRAQLEHLLQLAQIEKTNYARASQHYPPGRKLKHAEPFMQRLDGNIEAIQQALAQTP